MYFHDKNILAVDDYEDNLLLIQTIFEALGCNVRTACDAKTALMEVKKARPDLIILDLMMPNMSGIDFMNCLKNDNLLDMPILLLTANTNILREDAPDADSICYKPLDIANLIKEAVILFKSDRLK